MEGATFLPYYTEIKKSLNYASNVPSFSNVGRSGYARAIGAIIGVLGGAVGCGGGEGGGGGGQHGRHRQ